MSYHPVRTRILPRSECFLGLHFDLHPQRTDTELGAAVTEEGVRALLERVSPDYVQYDCKGHAGYAGYPTKVGWPSPGLVGDSLAIWRKVTREFNTGLYIHYSGVWDSVAIEHNPEWAVVNADGSRDSGSTSTFGPYVDELMIPQLKEVVDAYDLDGIWADGECWAAKLDWCDEAVERFCDETGATQAPRKAGEPHWQEWKTFHRRQFERYLAHWVGALHEHRPGIQITSNWMYTTFAPKPVEVELDYLSGDYSPTQSVDQARLEARYLASTAMPWDLMAWGFNWVEGTGHSLKTPEHLMQEAAVVLMQGGGFQIYNQPTRSGYLAPYLVDTLGRVADFCRARQAVSHRSTSYPQVALLYSTASQFERSDAVFTPYGCREEIEGLLHALLELHYSVDVLAEHQLEPLLDRYPVVVIPNSHVIPSPFRRSLLRYVENGGALLLLGDQCASLFPEELQVSIEQPPHNGALELECPSGLVSAAGPWVRVSLNGATGFAQCFPTRDTRSGGGWAATVSNYGRGRIAAVYGPIGLTYARGHHPLLREFIGSLMEHAFPDPVVRVEGPPCIDIAVRWAADGRLCVHLMNTAGLPLGNRTVTDFIPELHDIRVSVRMASRPAGVSVEPSGEQLELTWTDGPEGGTATVTLPSLAIHEVIAFE